MTAPQSDERTRLAVLDQLDLMDTDAETPFDRITDLARHLFGARLALITAGRGGTPVGEVTYDLPPLNSGSVLFGFTPSTYPTTLRGGVGLSIMST